MKKRYREEMYVTTLPHNLKVFQFCVPIVLRQPRDLRATKSKGDRYPRKCMMAIIDLKNNIIMALYVTYIFLQTVLKACHHGSSSVVGVNT